MGQARGSGERGESGDRFVVACALYAALVVVVLGHQVAAGEGALQSPVALLDALRGADWSLAEHAPDRHRPLFRALVLGLHGLAGDGTAERLYGLYVTVSALCLLGAAAAMDALLRALRFSGRQALLGTSLLLVGYPVVFGHDLPLHAREDPLALAVTCLTLLAAATLRGGKAPESSARLALVAALALAGAFVREACVAAALPALLLSARPLAQRALALAPALVALVAIRLLAGAPTPPTPETPWGAPPLPLEALLHALLAVGWTGAAAAVRLWDATPPRHALLGRGPVALVVAGTLLAAWASSFDARALTTLAPLAVALTLDLAASGRLRRLLATPAALATLALVAALGAGGLLALRARPDALPRVEALLGEGWNPGAAPLVEAGDLEGGTMLIDPTFSSRLQGPFTVAHAALGLALLAGFALRGRRWPPSRFRSGAAAGKIAS